MEIDKFLTIFFNLEFLRTNYVEIIKNSLFITAILLIFCLIFTLLTFVERNMRGKDTFTLYTAGVFAITGIIGVCICLFEFFIYPAAYLAAHIRIALIESYGPDPNISIWINIIAACISSIIYAIIINYLINAAKSKNKNETTDE